MRYNKDYSADSSNIGDRMPFIGRAAELNRLVTLTQKKVASFVVVTGRRRIGKSRLIKEFGTYFDNYYAFTGLAPHKHTTAEHQREEFSRQFARLFHLPFARYNDWSDILWMLGEQVKTGKTLILFDEISWMGSCDPDFLGKIKNFWDLQLKENPQLIFVICGSASAWIEKNILSSTGFVGRISYTLTLEALPLPDCNKFWPSHISAHEKCKILSVTGGVPQYLEEINPKRSAEENIKTLCFTKGGFLVEEFERIFSDIFTRKSDYYKTLLKVLAQGPSQQITIVKNLDASFHGRISEYLRELELSGFVKRTHTWNIKNAEESSLSQYRLSDNYIRFYLQYIEKNLSKINRNAYQMQSLTSLPQWSSMMGLQFENLILNSRAALISALEISPEDIMCDNPFFQKKTLKAPGCQIDYMIQTTFGTLYVCEIKFSKNRVGVSVIDEVQEKINALRFPRGFSCRPVLIHVNGVTQELIDSDYFAFIVDIAKMLL